MHAVVVSFAHWSLGFLGCYGNPTVKTPNLDRLATQSVVFDQHFAENFDSTAVNHAWWTGRYQFPLNHDEQAALPVIFGKPGFADIEQRFLVDVESSHAQQIQKRFGDMSNVESVGREEIFDKAIAHFHSGNDSLTEKSLLWIQSPGPRLNTDSKQQTEDLLSNYQRQAEEFDTDLGELLAVLEALEERAQPLLVITAGEGENILCAYDSTTEENFLSEERVHCPLLISISGSDQAGSRRQVLTQTMDIGPTLADWFEIDVSAEHIDGVSLLPLLTGGQRSGRERIYFGAGNSLAIRDGEFYLLRDESGISQLFLKPEDRYERADAAAQYPDVVVEMEQLLDLFLKDFQSDD